MADALHKSFTWRVFISFGLFIAFLMILVSGVILYIGPSGRAPAAAAWRMIGLTKGEWQNQHIIFGFAFSLLSLFHLLVINWKAFFSYVKSKAVAGIKSPGELVFIMALSLFFGIGTYYKIEPFSAILEFGKTIAKSWEGKPVNKPQSIQGSAGEMNSRSKPAE
ncbi:DUF4405 domain-containing protein [Chlorobium sp. BLA1]|uniref:DUF4405 domain-containing protein n=1 Tax=Candidatus Chlorobium masyuteum TaxID=2716876 RepID=UPI001420FFCF|nr:DUF4405 domain-containing protein [Candidatus Chlorobium masyuteum]NHQ60367.1 DUF4405 domain-containing protein [Candidatus Chlorobium masyuteum]NTU44061.1 DUF4405 domain-containing protein [Chlorobiaceae bacterium]